MPRINELEKVLEVQDEDKELALLSQGMKKAVAGARNTILTANKEIQVRFG
jgi:ABC-type Na+ transport system ATPase subunit NatA